MQFKVQMLGVPVNNSSSWYCSHTIPIANSCLANVNQLATRLSCSVVNISLTQSVWDHMHAPFISDLAFNSGQLCDHINKQISSDLHKTCGSLHGGILPCKSVCVLTVVDPALKHAPFSETWSKSESLKQSRTPRIYSQGGPLGCILAKLTPMQYTCMLQPPP